MALASGRIRGSLSCTSSGWWTVMDSPHDGEELPGRVFCFCRIDSYIYRVLKTIVRKRVKRRHNLPDFLGRKEDLRKDWIPRCSKRPTWASKYQERRHTVPQSIALDAITLHAHSHMLFDISSKYHEDAHIVLDLKHYAG